MRRWWWAGVVVVAAAAYAVIPRGFLDSADVVTEVAAQDAAPPQGGWSVEVTYVANAGVMLRAGDTKVLIDGLFRPYDGYPVLPEAHREQIERAQPPFDGIDLVLVSHVHGDHFHPESAARYLQSSADARLVASDQVAAGLQSLQGFAAVAPRVMLMTPGLGERLPVTLPGVTVDVLGVGHGVRGHADVRNLGHIVRIGGLKFLHVGDADFSQGVLERFDLAAERIDVAFLPRWFLTEGADFVRAHIRPKHIVAVHMPAGPHRGGPGVGAFPDAVPFVRLLERRYY